MKINSKISGFYLKKPGERLDLVAEMCSLSKEERGSLADTGGLPLENADSMIENVIGSFVLPMGIATYFRIDDEDFLIPMAVEEPSVVAAASNAARIARHGGGFITEHDSLLMIGQLQVVGLANPEKALLELKTRKAEIINAANERDPVLIRLGGGVKDIEIRRLETLSGPMVVLHLLVNCLDAMGANAVNTMAEGVASLVEEISGGVVLLRIISNLADRRLFRARAVFKKEILGPELIENIILAYHFAEADPYRAATHNKGVMNGISAVVRATGNDTRAIEAGAHSYAAVSGRYKPITSYRKNEDGDLIGEIELPLAVGLVGGATRSHPQARACIKILGVTTAAGLAKIIAAVGLAQNFAAMRALADEGIQRGHMRLHARNVAASAGASGDSIGAVSRIMIESSEINEEKARQILLELKT
ncbi:MAG: hydroxymethylglutaryl-CoA reductase, degradative [Candidatus Thermoplasmatota archaeon]|jgi:hydroxymethylglutaryl-CoA reductase|nr:hydroxymethylglutaryl-CoA reductase, degradative [Candidatus Thermoplasmatota archaeon]MDP7264052.1 hydroxymethylglutaryl-CoA reductase, degradative [Candidatus Thermoplasmatota archaeon]